MGLAYEIWDYAYWFVYVLAMVLIEAWWFGKKLQVPLLKSMVISLVANALTAFCCVAANPGFTVHKGGGELGSTLTLCSTP